LAVRQANPGLGIRREGGGSNNKSSFAKSVEEETWQSQPPDWHCRDLKPETAVELAILEDRTSALAPTFPAHSLLLSLFLTHPLPRQESQVLGGTRLKTGSSSTIVIGKPRGA
jgi:hypothetical protein